MNLGKDMLKVLFVRAEWDDEAGIWVATSDDIPGLATESDTVEHLFNKLSLMIPELLAANHQTDSTEIHYEILARKFSTTYLNIPE